MVNFILRIIERSDELPNSAQEDLYHMLEMALLMGIAEKLDVDISKFDNAGFGKPRKENRVIINRLLNEVKKEFGY